MAFDIIRETTIDIVNSSLSSIKLPAWDILKFILPTTSKNMQTELLPYPKYMAYETMLSRVKREIKKYPTFASINAIQLILSIFSLPPYTSHSSPLLSLYSKSNCDSGNE